MLLLQILNLPNVLEKEHSFTVQKQLEMIVNCLYDVDIKTKSNLLISVLDDCGAAGETKPEGYSVDDHWRKLVMEIYYNHIISTVKASEIIINLSSVLTLGRF